MRRAVCLALLLTALAPPARAQEDEPPPRAERRRAVREGTHVFRRILADAGIEPLDKFDALSGDPSRSLLIVLGDLDQIDNVPGGLEKFVRAGGAVLVASDRPFESDSARDQLKRTAGVSINRETLFCPDEELCYKGLRYCPVVIPLGDARRDLFTDRSGPNPVSLTLITNTPSMLLRRAALPGGVRQLGLLPKSCVPEGPDDPENRAPGEDGHPAFMVGGDLGAGRVLVLADHSVFINEMMLPTDTGNVELTANAIAWLQGEAPRRDRALLVEDGRIETKFDLPVKPGTLPLAEAMRLLFARRNALLAKGEEKLTQLEDEAFYDNALLDWLSRRGWPPGRLGLWAAGVGTAALALVLLFRVAMRHRFSHDQTAPSLVTAVSGNFPSRSLLEQRNQVLLLRNNLNEPAAALARHWFAGLGMEVPPGGAAPPFRVKGGWGERRRRARRLRALWELASGRAAEPVGAPAMWRLQREMEELGAARGRGEWSVDTAEARQPARAAV